jgi:sialate O-acetylesterase
MQRTVALTDEAAEAAEDIRTVDVRYFNGRSWVNVTAGNVSKISAVAVYFSTEIVRRQKTPVGIFVAAVGGTRIEAWLPAEAFPDTESGRLMKPLVNDPEVLKAAEEDRAGPLKPYGQHRLARWGLGRAVPASLFEQLIRPFADLPVCGVVWYQGEGNTSSVEQAQEYRLWLVNLISAYRNLWNSPDLPFVIIQLPDFDGRPAWKVLQDVQASVAESTKQVAVVDIKEFGDPKDIHPRRKKEVGRRAAEAALGLQKE